MNNVNEPHVVACVMIFCGDSIEYQGAFQVFTSQEEQAVTVSDGSVVHFRHSYSKSKAHIEMSTSRDNSSVDLVVPINRSKVKWKQCQLGGFDVRYRCVFENIRELKETKKLRRRAAIASSTQTPDGLTVFYTGSSEGEG